MEVSVINVTESERGCGLREKPGAAYIRIYEPGGDPCGWMPFPLVSCPCCHGGIKRQRGINVVPFETLKNQTDFSSKKCTLCGKGNALSCLSIQNDEKVAINFIGEAHYPSMFEIVEEGNRMGYSRRLNAIPDGIKDLSDFWVALVYPKPDEDEMDAWDIEEIQPKKNSRTKIRIMNVNIPSYEEGRGYFHKSKDVRVEGMVFKFKKASIEMLVNDEMMQNPSKNMANIAKRGGKFVKVNNTVQGGVQTKPNKDGEWGIYKDGEFIQPAEVDKFEIPDSVYERK